MVKNEMRRTLDTVENDEVVALRGRLKIKDAQLKDAIDEVAVVEKIASSTEQQATPMQKLNQRGINQTSCTTGGS